MSSPKKNLSPKSDRILPHRNRQHILRPIPQPRTQAHTLLQPEHSNASKVSVTSPTPTAFSPPSKPFPFFDLPGEIRNKIYDLVIPETRVVISGTHPQKELEKLKAKAPTKKHKRPRHRLLGEFTGDVVSTSFLLTCRQMNEEAIQIIYARTIFCFDRFVVINKFLDTIPSAAAKSIGRLEITHTGYAEPEWTDDRVWKLRHDEKWSMTSERIKRGMTCLESLKLALTVFDWPCRLELDESWAKPLLNLAGDGLDWVEVKLMHDRFHPNKVAATAKELETKMMSADGKKKKLREAQLQAAQEKKRREEARKKATKALRIRLPLGDKTMLSNTPVKKVVKSRGLEQYARYQPAVAFCQ
ncbi:hypothetical protein A1O1_01274 [Capronia coronata CBS 617.96]|uniref:DUF7730 domain-containing protein n=1 Tax=Capronia coronata CBS 617.96 TaxID=1182541 RepID=W9YUE9_9EURO|nr:uncharacterized protein A1O1_01274 [Capronia coronata CBS 617.96]EXJ96148.1 hypothetical protein A1O1_01274 [Capronia coronata CBS 617.96]